MVRRQSSARAKWFSVGRVEPNLGPIAREPEFADDDAAADERRHAARQVGELAGAYLTQPDIELAVVIREKATNLPSGEISAPSSAPSQLVSGVNVAPASGFSVTAGRQRTAGNATASRTTAATTHCRRFKFAVTGASCVASLLSAASSAVVIANIAKTSLGVFATQRQAVAVLSVRSSCWAMLTSRVRAQHFRDRIRCGFAGEGDPTA